MNKAVHKYRLSDRRSVQTISLPVGAEPLHLAFQRDDLCLWCLVDIEAPMQLRTIDIYGTGHPVDPPDAIHLGTFGEQDMEYVWHVFLRNP